MCQHSAVLAPAGASSDEPAKRPSNRPLLRDDDALYRTAQLSAYMGIGRYTSQRGAREAIAAAEPAGTEGRARRMEGASVRPPIRRVVGCVSYVPDA